MKTLDQLANMLSTTVLGRDANSGDAFSGGVYAQPSTAAAGATSEAAATPSQAQEHPVLTPLQMAAGLRRSDEVDDPRLPAEAARRLIELKERREDARAIDFSLADEEYELHTDVMRSRHRLKDIKKRVRTLKYDPSPAAEENAEEGEDHPAFIAEKRKLAQLEDKLRRVQARREKARTILDPVGRVVTNIEDYLSSRSGFSKVKPVTPAKGETVQSVSRRIADLRADLGAVEAAPALSSEAKARAIADIDLLAKHGAISVAEAIEHRSALQLPRGKVTIVGANKDGSLNTWDMQLVGPEMALLAWLFRDELIQRVHREIDAIANDEKALSREERAERIAHISSEILQEERTLAAIIWREELHELWPADIDPRAVLSIDGPAPEKSWR